MAAKKVTKIKQPKAPDSGPSRPVDLVLVKVREGDENRGEYGWAIRNPGEVFEMDTKAMRVWPLVKGEVPLPPSRGETIVIETDLGQFELPPWVELVDPDDVDDAALVPKGHPGKFDDSNVKVP